MPRPPDELASITVAGPYADLAAAAHEFWRERMAQRGWSSGPRFDAKTRVHDGLVPFSQLDPDDQWTAVEILESLEAGPKLAGHVRYPRGDEAPLRTRDMVIDLAVESTGQTPEQGRVVAWTTNTRSGRLESITVRWASGEVSQHPALAGELRLAALGPPPHRG